MIKLFIFTAFFMLSAGLFAAEHQMIDTLGVSSKGQFVALEEYGYKAQSHTYYVTIKVMNVWKKEYVGQRIEVEIPAHRPDYLSKARARARLMAQDHLRLYGISG
jgi:predicted secreted protein